MLRLTEMRWRLANERTDEDQDALFSVDDLHFYAGATDTSFESGEMPCALMAATT
jgi:hypothetical protein